MPNFIHNTPLSNAKEGAQQGAEKTMVSYPCAKVNLGLYVVERRPDGYHNLETVFYPIPLHDELQVESNTEGAADDEFTLEGIPVAGDAKDNLVMRVVAQLRDSFAIPPLRIKLTKNIPSGAGLGGGSSDAAFMMRMLNDMFALGLSPEEMEQRVSLLGADCAFFIRCRPTMAEGIGNIFSPINVSLKGLHLVLVKPSDFVSTKEAYSMVRPARPARPLRQTIKGGIKDWKSHLLNDFETSVLPLHPTILNIKEELYRQGALYAVMSGSGSSVFGLFSEPQPQAHELFAPHFVFTGEL